MTQPYLSETIPLPSGVTIRSIGEGALGAIIRSKDWSQTQLGPFNTWPLALQGYVGMILSLPTPAIIFWGEYQIQIYNDGYAEIMGPRHPKYLGCPYKECWPDTYPTIYPWMRRVLDLGEIVEVDRTLIPVTRHGFDEEAFFTFSFSPLKDDQGEIAGILQIVTEVTKPVLAERRLKTIRALAPRSSLDALGVYQNAVDALAANPNDLPFAILFSPQTKAGAETEIGLWRSFGTESASAEREAAAQLGPLVQKVFATGEVIVATHQHHKALVLPIRRSQSEAAKGVAILGINPRLDFDQKYREFFESVAREIAVVLAAAEEIRLLERSRLELHEFFMQAPSPLVVLVGPQHRYSLANPPYEKMIGGRDVIGKTVLEAFTKEEVGGFVERLDQVYATGVPYEGQELPLSLPDENGTIQNRYINVAYHPFRDPDGSIKGVLAVHQDITDQVIARKELEAIASDLAKALKTRDDFISVASHELKTPLTPLKLQLQSLTKIIRNDALDSIPPERVLKIADMSDKQITRLTHLIENLLDVSRISSGKLTLVRETRSLSTIVSNTVDRFDPQAAEVRCVIERHIEDCVVADVDPLRIEQAVANVLSNAIKYAPGKKITVSLSKKSSLAVLSIQDHGIGIDSRNFERIFQRFEQVASKANVGGLGIGLYITRQIVEAHGGRISVESRPNEGTTFTIELPLHAMQAVAAPRFMPTEDASLH